MESSPFDQTARDICEPDCTYEISRRQTLGGDPDIFPLQARCLDSVDSLILSLVNLISLRQYFLVYDQSSNGYLPEQYQDVGTPA